MEALRAATSSLLPSDLLNIVLDDSGYRRSLVEENTPEAQALAFLGFDIAAYNRRMQPIAIRAIESAATALLQQENH